MPREGCTLMDEVTGNGLSRVSKEKSTAAYSVNAERY